MTPADVEEHIIKAAEVEHRAEAESRGEHDIVTLEGDDRISEGPRTFKRTQHILERYYFYFGEVL